MRHRSLIRAILPLTLVSCAALLAACSNEQQSTNDQQRAVTPAASGSASGLDQASGSHMLPSEGSAVQTGSSALRPLVESEAVRPGIVRDEDLRSLPTNKSKHPGAEELARESAREKQQERVQESPGPAPAAVSAAMLAKQKEYLAAWERRKAALDGMSTEDRDRALAELKRSHLGDGQ